MVLLFCEMQRMCVDVHCAFRRKTFLLSENKVFLQENFLYLFLRMKLRLKFTEDGVFTIQYRNHSLFIFYQYDWGARFWKDRN
jgi:hypothetical protein